MKSKRCEQCGAPLGIPDERGMYTCQYCGSQRYAEDAKTASENEQYEQEYRINENDFSPSLPTVKINDRIIAALLNIFLGVFGVGYFYLGKVGKGLLSFIFCYTGIPAIIGFIKGVRILTMTDDAFAAKYRN